MLLISSSGLCNSRRTATGTPLGVFAVVLNTKQPTGSVVFSRSIGQLDTATLGSANAKAYVYSDPDIVYEAQSTGTPTQDIYWNRLIRFQQLQVILTTGRSKEGVTTTTSSGIATVVGLCRLDLIILLLRQYARLYVIFPASVRSAITKR